MKTTIIAALLILATATWAQPRWHGDGDPPNPTRWGQRAIAALNLTAEQQTQFDRLHSAHQKKQIELRSKLQTARIDLRDIVREEKVDKKKVDAKIIELGKLRTDMMLSKSDFWFDVKKILTPEQQKVWKERFGPMSEPRGPRFHKRW